MPEDIRKAMELQMTAERQKRAKILESEGVRQSRINQSEAEAKAIESIADATAQGILVVARALEVAGGEKAAQLQVAEKWVDAFRQLAKESNTVILPANLQHPGSMIAEAMAIYDTVKKKPVGYPVHVEKH